MNENQTRPKANFLPDESALGSGGVIMRIKIQYLRAAVMSGRKVPDRIAPEGSGK